MGRIRPLHLFYPNKQRQGGNDRIARRGRIRKNRKSRLNSWWKGTACAARYLPAQARGVGAVALAHGWSMVAGGDLEDYAAAIVEQAWRR